MIELVLNEELKKELLEYLTTRSYSIGTMKLYKVLIDKMFRDYKVLNKKTALDFLKKYNRPYHRAILSLINDYCFYYEIDFNLKIPRQIKKPRPVPHTLTTDEIQKMIQCVEKPWDLFLRTVFGFGAGLRVSEVIRLSWQRFNWYEWLNDLDESGNRKNGLYEVIDTKRGKNFHVTVPKRLMEDYYLMAKEGNLLNEFRIPDPGVIYDFGINTWNKSLKITNLAVWKHSYAKMAYDWVRYNLLEKKCEPVLGKRIRIHWLRHSRATFLLEQDIPIQEISKLLGHSDIRTSMIYAETSMKKIKKSMENIDSI